MTDDTPVVAEATVPATKAVVAICVELSPMIGAEVFGMPVKTGDAKGA